MILDCFFGFFQVQGPDESSRRYHYIITNRKLLKNRGCIDKIIVIACHCELEPLSVHYIYEIETLIGGKTMNQLQKIMLFLMLVLAADFTLAMNPKDVDARCERMDEERKPDEARRIFEPLVGNGGRYWHLPNGECIVVHREYPCDEECKGRMEKILDDQLAWYEARRIDNHQPKPVEVETPTMTLSVMAYVQSWINYITK